MADDVSISAAKMISAVFENIEAEQLEKSNALVGAWKEAVGSISSRKNKNLGEKIRAHSKVVDLKNGTLLVEADHPGWIQLLRTYEQFIRTGLNRAVPELNVAALAFRLSGSDVELKTVDYDSALLKERAKLSAQYEKDEKAFSRFEKNGGGAETDAPDSLKKIFEDMRNSLLTKKQ